MYKPLILNDNLKPNIFDSILDPLQKSARFTMDLDSIAAAMGAIQNPRKKDLQVIIQILIIVKVH